MGKLNLKNKLEKRQGKPVNKFLYNLLRVFIVKALARPMNIEVIDKVGYKNLKKEQFILIGNHTSRCDYLYVGEALKSVPVNFMASHTEFHRAHLHFIFDLMHVIPKKNFTNDVHAIKELKQVINKGGNVCFFPEGKSSISGTNQPVMLGTGKLIKHLGLPVYYLNIKGGFLSNTQWNILNRPGKVEVTLDKLFSPEDIINTPVEEIESKINDAIYNDDFIWNNTARVKFKGNDSVCDKLEEHLFYCPKCHSELTMKGNGNVFKCEHCGNGTTVNEYYDLIPFNKDCVIPLSLRVWYELQRRHVYKQILNNPDFKLQEKVTLGTLTTDHYIDKKHTSEVVGEGVIELTRTHFSYKGTKNGEPFEINYDIKNMPTVILETDSSYFGSYINGEYHEFKPERPVTTKFLLAVEECHRLAGGKWQNTLPKQQWIYKDIDNPLPNSLFCKVATEV